MTFLEFVQEKCRESGVAFVLSERDYVETDCGTRCNGYFDGKSKTLAVATGKEWAKWFKTLIHEYAHMTQWIDQSSEWVKSTFPVDAEAIVELWYDRQIELTKTQRKKWISLGRDVELGAERRTVELIRQHKLPISVPEYTRHANAYLYFWTFTGLVRRWYEIGKEPYNIPEIVEAMPTTFDNDYAALPRKYEALYRRYC